jgi:hypothetical protein
MSTSAIPDCYSSTIERVRDLVPTYTKKKNQSKSCVKIASHEVKIIADPCGDSLNEEKK